MRGKKLMLVLGVAIVLLVIIIVVTNMNKEKQQDVQDINNVPVAGLEENTVEEFVDKKADGTKVNISPELSKTKIVDGLEITNIRLTEDENGSLLLADVKNPTDNTLGDFTIDIIMLDEEGNELTVIGGYINKVAPGETVEINSSASVDIANAYDFKISK